MQMDVWEGNWPQIYYVDFTNPETLENFFTYQRDLENENKNLTLTWARI